MELIMSDIYDLKNLKKLSGLNESVKDKDFILDEVEEDSEPVQDGDNDAKGYQYDADVYNMFGDEDQKMKYVPARYADNPLRDPVVENKSLFDYIREIEER